MTDPLEVCALQCKSNQALVGQGMQREKEVHILKESLDEATQAGIDLVKELQRRPERMAA